MLLYHDATFLEHETGDHPESAQRIRGLPDALAARGLLQQCRSKDAPAINRRRLERVHSPGYIEEIQAFAKSGGGRIEADTVMGLASYDVAMKAAGAACHAVERVVAGEDRHAFCLIRPPGHHALNKQAMGFCIFNNVALAARAAIDELGLTRVLIVDWDVHHGNGTQATFWRDPAVGFLSAHRWPFYPGTGNEDETGEGEGLGTTVNLPFDVSTPRRHYRDTFRRKVEDFADKMRPELVLISAGFDAHHLDPIGGLGLETEDFVELTNVVLDVAATHAGGRVVSVLEGGYNPSLLADCVALHLETMLDREARPMRQQRGSPLPHAGEG